MGAQANVYEVENVKVDVVAQSSLEARDKAFHKAQTDAFAIMATRFLEGDELKNFKAPDYEKIARMVRDVELISEQASMRRYVGVFNIRFKSSSLRSHFGKSPLTQFVTADEKENSGIIVLPFFEQNGKTYIWDIKQNPFLKSMREDISPNFIVPPGDTLDNLDVRPDFISSYSNGLSKRLRGRFGAPEVIVLLARYDAAKNPPLEIDFYRTDKTKKLDLAKTLAFRVTKEKTLGQFFQTVTPAIVAELNGNWKQKVELPPAVTQEVMDGTTPVPTPILTTDERKPYDPVKSEPVRGETYTAQRGTASAVVQFQSLQQWMAMRREISSTPAITGMRIVNLRTFESDVQISYLDQQSMINNLTARGFIVRQTGPSSYLLMRAQ